MRFLKKHQPLPLPVNPSWKSGTGNHPPLVAVDPDGSLSIDPHHDYYIGQTLADGKLYELQLSDHDTLDFTAEALFALLAPAAALSWLGAKEVWLANVLTKKLVRIERSFAGSKAREALLIRLPIALP